MSSAVGSQVGGLTYFVPDKADAIGVFEAATREYTQVDAWSPKVFRRALVYPVCVYV